MSQKFLQDIRVQALAAMSNVGYADVGTITAYDPINRLVRVLLAPATEDTQALGTGWIPLTTPWGGNGWGMFAAPAPGVACMVHYQSGNKQVGYASLISFGGSNRPVPVDSGEFWLVHQSGSKVKLTNDGNISIESTSGSKVELMNDGTISIESTGVVKIGDVNAGDLKKLIRETAIAVFNMHTHSGGPPPDQQMSNADLTQHVTAN